MEDLLIPTILLALVLSWGYKHLPGFVKRGVKKLRKKILRF